MQRSTDEILATHFPVDSVDIVSRLLKDHRAELRISRERTSKLGDFRPAGNGKPHRISVNANLNVYEFLLVFLHELSHLLVYFEYGKNVRPHGREWKEQYGRCIRECVGTGCFHASLSEPLLRYSYRVKASGIADLYLVRRLRSFDRSCNTPSWQLLEELPANVLFLSRNGRLFRKEDQLRKRYRCYCLDNDRHYLFHPAAWVLEKGNEKQSVPGSSMANYQNK